MPAMNSFQFDAFFLLCVGMVSIYRQTSVLRLDDFGYVYRVPGARAVAITLVRLYHTHTEGQGVRWPAQPGDASMAWMEE